MKPNKTLYAAVFLVGIVMLVEAASTFFVLMNAGHVMADAAVAAWGYAIMKGIVSLFAIVAGYAGIKNKS